MNRLLFFIMFSTVFSLVGLRANSWENAKSEKKALLDVYWDVSSPFIYNDKQGQLTGLEFEILGCFQSYLKATHDVDLTLNWIKAQNFNALIKLVSGTLSQNSIGVSALSITEERLKTAQFTAPYLADVAVLVTSKGTPILESHEEVIMMLQSMSAVTIKGTKYESLLLNLKEQLQIDFEIIYIESNQNVLKGVLAADNRFGFIDLPIYLLLIREGGDLTRQNFFTVKGNGYGFMLPTLSDWKQPLDDFFLDPNYQPKIDSIISKYLGGELYSFMQKSFPEQQLGTSILTKEKELQLALLKNANERLQREKLFTRVLTLGLSVFAMLVVIIGWLFYRKRNSARLILSQKHQNERYQQDIKQKNEQLVSRNARLIAMNEEKNNLVRILAHDLRSPLSQIMMIADVLEKSVKELSDTNKELLDQVGGNARRLNEMVAKILDLDSIEEDHLKIMRERVDVREVLMEVVKRFKTAAGKKGIEIRLSGCKQNYLIWTDHLLLTLIIENLVSNAVKFSRPHSLIKLVSDCAYDSVTFEVHDSGPGLTEEDQKQLFGRFKKLSAKPTGGESSTGLGLSIVKKYVDDLEGEVWAESKLGKGSTFFVRLSV